MHSNMKNISRVMGIVAVPTKFKIHLLKVRVEGEGLKLIKAYIRCLLLINKLVLEVWLVLVLFIQLLEVIRSPSNHLHQPVMKM